MKKLCIIVGGSCVGKTTLENQLVKEYLVEKMRIHTTRPLREGEDNVTLLDNDIVLHETIGVNGATYKFLLPKEDGNYIVSIIDIEEAIKLKKAFENNYYKNRCCMVLLDRDEGIVKRCIKSERPAIEVVPRLKQYKEIKEKAISLGVYPIEATIAPAYISMKGDYEKRV